MFRQGLFAVVFCLASAGAHAASFTPLGSSGSFALGVSANGGAVVGRASTGWGNEAFIWTPGGGMVGLGSL